MGIIIVLVRSVSRVQVMIILVWHVESVDLSFILIVMD